VRQWFADWQRTVTGHPFNWPGIGGFGVPPSRSVQEADQRPTFVAIVQMTRTEMFFDLALGAGGALILLAALTALNKLLG
jgi:hypothetical protein